MIWPSFSLPNIAKNSALIKRALLPKHTVWFYHSGSPQTQASSPAPKLCHCIHFPNCNENAYQKFIPQFCSTRKGENYRRRNKTGYRSGEHWLGVNTSQSCVAASVFSSVNRWLGPNQQKVIQEVQPMESRQEAIWRGGSLVVQWLRFCTSNAGPWIWFLVRELDPTCELRICTPKLKT